MTTAAEKITQLNLVYAYSPVLCLVSGDISSVTVTGDNLTNTFTATAHGFVEGMPLQFSNSGGALFEGISSGVNYFVRNPAANTFQVSLSIGGAITEFTSNGSGTNTATEQPLGDGANQSDLINLYPDGSVVWSIWVRHEVNYEGGGRVGFVWPLASLGDNGQVDIAEVTPSVIPLSGQITYRYMVVLRGGSATAGDLAGAVAITLDTGGRIISLQGESFKLDPLFP